MWWSTCSGKIELNITKRQAESCTKPGVDASDDISLLREEPKIKRQLKKLDPKLVREELDEYGAWDEKELASHEDNLTRLLWIACGDIADGNL